MLSFRHSVGELHSHLLLGQCICQCDVIMSGERRQLAPVTSPALLTLQGLRQALGHGR